MVTSNPLPSPPSDGRPADDSGPIGGEAATRWADAGFGDLRFTMAHEEEGETAVLVDETMAATSGRRNAYHLSLVSG